jgi:tight adherence protein C
MFKYLFIFLSAAFVFLLAQALLEMWQRAQARIRLRALSAPASGSFDLAGKMKQVLAALASGLERRLPKGLRESLARDIEKAGWEGWFPGRLALAQAGCFLAAWLLSWHLLELGVWSLLVALGFACLPLVALRDGAERKLAALRKALPDFLDMLTSCVEAGLSFDLSLGRVAQRLAEGPLRRELELCLSQMRMGQTRREALKALAARIGLDDLSSLVGALLQADQMGAPLGPALRAQSGQLRALRSLRVQKQAAQAPVKMLFPLMVFILPVVFLVLFGPLFIKWSSNGF